MITAVPFDPTPIDGETPGPFVEVRVTEATTGGFAPVVGADVTLRLATDDDSETDGPLASGTLTVASEVTGADGIATFDTSLSIAQPNEPMFTDYELVPQAILTEGSVSSPFDIWGAGCQGSGCTITLRDGKDSYKTTEDVALTASDLTSGLTFTCPGQTLILGNHIFSHATFGGAGGPVLLTSRITRQEMKAATNNGQPSVQWCIGLKSSAPWIHNHASFTTQDTNGATPGWHALRRDRAEVPRDRTANLRSLHRQAEQ